MSVARGFVDFAAESGDKTALAAAAGHYYEILSVTFTQDVDTTWTIKSAASAVYPVIPVAGKAPGGLAYHDGGHFRTQPNEALVFNSAQAITGGVAFTYRVVYL